MIYSLYDRAMNLEPEGEPEIPFSQRMMLNRAHAFITKRMERRQRVHQQKRNKKLMYKLSDLISNQLKQIGGTTADSPVTYHGSYTTPGEGS